MPPAPESALDLSRRRRRPELMDGPDLELERHEGALRALARLNGWSGVARLLWGPIEALARSRAPSAPPLRVLDLATGAGDVPLRLARRAQRAGLPLEIAACDRSARAVVHARERLGRAGVEARIFRADALEDDWGAWDVVTSSLFLHHLDEGEALRLLRLLSARARRLALVCDLERCRAGWGLAWTAGRLLTRSDVVRVDGPRSVEGAFTAEEALELARRAGLVGARVARRFPYRWVLSAGGAA